MIRKMTLLAFILSPCLYMEAQDLIPKHNDKGQFGYAINGSSEFAIKPQWDEARQFNEQGVAIVRKGADFGLIGKDGKPIGKDMGYSIIAPYDGTDKWLVALGGKRVEDSKSIKNRAGLNAVGFKGSLSYSISGADWGVLNQDGTPVLAPKYQEISSIMPGNLIVFQQKDLFGFVDLNGNVKKEAIYDVVTPFNNQGVAAVRTKKTGKWSLINSSGATIIGEDKDCSAFAQFLNDVWGSLNTIGADSVLKNPQLKEDPQRIMPMMGYSSSWINSDYPYVVAVKNIKEKKKTSYEIGIFDLQGNVLLPFGNGITGCNVPSENIVVAYRDEQCGFYDLTEKTFSPVENRIYLPFKNGCSMSYASKDNVSNDFYLVDKKGNKVSNRFDDVTVFNDRYVVRSGNKYGIITKDGTEIVPIECLEISDAGEDLFVIRDNSGFVGYIDSDGGISIPFEYSDGSSFVQGYAIVSKKQEGSFKKQKGIIDKTNKVVVPIQYEKVAAYVDDKGQLTVWVSNENLYSEFDMNTGNLKQTEYTEMKNVGFGILVKNTNNRYGLLQNGEEVVPCAVEDSELIPALYSYMQENEIRKITAVDARSIAIKQNEQRNSFKLTDKIGQNYWDF